MRPLIAHCGVVTLDVQPGPDGASWDIHYAGHPVGMATVAEDGVEAFAGPTQVTRPTIEEACVRLAQLLNDSDWVPAGAVR